MSEQEILLRALEIEWHEDSVTDDERRADIVREVQDMAEGQSPVCSRCKKTVVYLPLHHGLAPGHIYSEAGVSEFQISRLCEYCFDLVTRDPEDDD